MTLNIFKIKNLELNFFRNYKHLNFPSENNNIIITGNNGSGKTNILEAVSLLIPGRGLRSSKIEHMDTHHEHVPWFIDAAITCGSEVNYVKTGRTYDTQNSRRFVEINSDSQSKNSELSSLMSVNWVVPQMNHIFITGTSVRRKLLDKIVSNFEPEHSKHLLSYEYNLKERNNLLKQQKYDSDWMSVIENSIAQTAVTIATSRVKTLQIIQESMDKLEYDFPKAILSIDGDIEKQIYDRSSLDIENDFKVLLKKNRQLDFLTKRTNAGIHRSDLLVYDQTKAIKAENCSTGEQKLLLISIFLAEIFAQIDWKNKVPVLLLDDIAAHLDEKNRMLLCEIISSIGAQAWITGTDSEMFDFMKGKAAFVKIINNELVA